MLIMAHSDVSQSPTAQLFHNAMLFQSLAETCQCPDGDTVYLQNTSTKIIFRISSRELVRNTHRLCAVLNSSTITTEIGRTEELPCAVVYNSCTNSDEPEMTCMESQVTIWGKQVPFKHVSFDLYKGIDKIKRLSTFTLLPLPEGQHYTINVP